MNKRIIKAYTLITILALVGLMIPWQGVEAGQLTEARDYLGTMTHNLSSGETHEIYFKPTTNVSGGSGVNKVILVFPDDDDGTWCANAGSDLTVSTSGLRETGATVLPGSSLSASCIQGSGASSYDTITISGVDDLTAGTLYGVKISDGSTAKLGTPASGSDKIITIKTNDGSSDVDSRDIAVAILDTDQIGVSAIVNPTLSFSISPTSLDLGTLTPDTVSTAGPSTLTVSTNAKNGAVIDVKDSNAGLSNGSHTIQAAPSSEVTNSGNIEKYGVYGSSSTFTIDEGFDDDSASDVAISTSYQTFATVDSSVSSATVSLYAKVVIKGSTPAGSYSDTLTVIATGKF